MTPSMQALCRSAVRCAARPGAVHTTITAGMASRAAAQLVKLSKATNSYAHILEAFTMQPGSFDAEALSAALQWVPRKAGGYAAGGSAEYEALCSAATAHLAAHGDAWSTAMVAKALLGIGQVANPGTGVFLSAEVAPPTVLRGLTPSAQSFVEAGLSHMAAALGDGHASVKEVSTTLAALGHMAPALGDLPEAGPVLSTALSRWGGLAGGASGTDLAQVLFCLGMQEASSVPSDALDATWAACRPGLHLPSAALATSLWAGGVLTKQGRAVPQEAAAALGDTALVTRGSLRPLDIGLVAWGAQVTGAAAAHPTLLPLLAVEAGSGRMAGRLGGANHALLARVLADVALPSEAVTGDAAAVRGVPLTLPPLPAADTAVWPYNVEHAGVLGCLKVE